MPETLGSTLASARRALGKSLAEAESATRIRAKLLEALEKGDYELLPNAAYVRGYIISYAKFLELDPAPLLKLFSDETGHRTNREQMRELRLPDQVVPHRDRAHAVPWRGAAAIAAVVALVALAIWGIGRFAGGPEELPPVPNVSESTTTPEAGESTETSTPPIVTTDTVTPDTTTSPAVEGEPFTLKIDVAADGASWLRVTVDGLKAYEGTLAGGQSKEWEVTDEALLRIGKPGSVTVFRNGEALTIPSAAETPEFTVTATDPAPGAESGTGTP